YPAFPRTPLLTNSSECSDIALQDKEVTMSRNSNIRLLGLSSAVALCISASAAFEVINLASNEITAGVHFDPNLINPWGMTSSPTGPFWVANNGTDTSTLYDGNGVPQPVGDPLIVALSPGFAPTGIVYNAGDAF